MYYYGNNGYYPAYGQTQTPCCGGTYGGYTTGYGIGGAIWIVLFILLVIKAQIINGKGNLSFLFALLPFFW